MHCVLTTQSQIIFHHHILAPFAPLPAIPVPLATTTRSSSYCKAVYWQWGIFGSRLILNIHLPCQIVSFVMIGRDCNGLWSIFSTLPFNQNTTGWKVTSYMDAQSIICLSYFHLFGGRWFVVWLIVCREPSVSILPRQSDLWVSGLFSPHDQEKDLLVNKVNSQESAYNKEIYDHNPSISS